MTGRPRLRPLPSPVLDETWERLRQAAIELVLERGYGAVDVEAIVARAGVAREDFDRRFADKRDCCDRAYEANIADFDRAVLGAYLAAPAWRDALRAAAYAAAAYIATHPAETRYGEIAMREGGEMAQAVRDRYLQRIVDLIDAGRFETAHPDALSRSVAEGALGSIYGLLMKRLAEGAEAVIATELVPELMCIAVRPYLGHEAAMAELRIPPPEVAGA